MRKILFLFLPLLAAFPSFVSACGEHAEEVSSGSGIVGFGFIGGVVSALLVIAIVLSIMVLNKRGEK